MLQKHNDALLTCPLFEEVNGEDLKKMMECFNPVVKEYKKNEFLTLEGENYDGLGILLKGKAAVTKENAAGKRIILEIIEPGKIFGEMAAFSGKGVWPATVVAQEPCTAMFLPTDKLSGNCGKQCIFHRMLITNMLKIISGKALMLDRKVEYLAMKSLRQRISTMLLEEYKRKGHLRFVLPMNRNEVADFLNVSRPSLSREMCKMRDEGIIDFHMSSVQIKDLNTLKHMTD